MSNDADNQKPMKLKTRAFDRNLALARVGVVTGSQMAGHSVRNLFRGQASRERHNREFYRRQAEYLADELGRLKGSVMKVGQMLSVYGQYFMPPEAIDVLQRLQDDSPPVAWSDLEPVVIERLGHQRLAELEIDPEPLAAASLGQVHRARRRSDGRALCIKIQYPGLAQAIDSDINTLTQIVRLARLIPKGVNLSSVMNEVRDMIYQEVDYVHELRMTQAYAERLAGDSRYIVPETFPEYCTDQILVTSFEPGENVRSDTIQLLAQQRRDRLSENAIDLFFREFFDWGMVQTDPHFGNYKVRLEDDGRDRMVLLDFGAVRQFEPGFLDAYYEIVAGAYFSDSHQLIQGAIGIGLLRPESPPRVFNAFAEVGFLMIEPFTDDAPAELLTADGAYRWGDSDLPWRVSHAVSRAALSRWFRVPPREIVFLHRRLGGVFVLLAVLRAELRGRPLLARHLEKMPQAGESGK